MKITAQLTLTVAMAGLLVLASGCQTGPTHKQGFDFSHYHTFAIRPLPTTGTPRDPTLAARLGPTARQAAQETLSAKGFKEVPESEADFQVNLLFDYAPVPEDEKGRQERHMLEIDIIDSKSTEVVWSDWRHRTTDRAISPEGAQKLVAEMLKPFPPGVKSTGAGGS
jgi:hypothetical protein